MAENGGDSGSAQPLLADREELAGAWDPDVEGEAHHITDECTVAQMLKEHAHDALRFLQTGGIEKIGEFCAPDDLVFGAFEESTLLTFGSEERHVDAEREWRKCLELRRKKRGSTLHEGTAGWTRQVWVEAFVVPIRGACNSGSEGLLHPLLKQWNAKRCSFAVFSLPAVQSCILYKWHTFARKLLLTELALYCCWMSAYFTFTAALQDEDLSLPLADILQTPRGRVTVIAESIALLCMAPFLALEAGSMLAYGWGWFRDPTNAMDMCTYALQILVSVTHLGRIWVASHWLTYLLAVQCILLMFRLQYFTQCIRATRFSFSSMIRGVLMDIGWVLVFVVLVCVGYGAAIHITFRQDKDAPEEYDSFPKAVLDMIEHAYGDLELKKFYGSKNPVFATGLALSYMLIMGYVIINLVLGLVIQSLDRLTAHDDAKQLLNQARAIDEVESLLPAWYEQRQKKRWHPEYVHVLRINPEKLDSIELDALWTQHGAFAPVMPRKSRGALNTEVGGSSGSGSGSGSSSEDEQKRGRGKKREGGYKERKESKGVKEELIGLKQSLQRQEKMLEELMQRVLESGGSKEKETGDQWGAA